MYSSTLINERENYFHKPIVQLNSYNKLNDTMTLASSLYYSGGEGGGSGSAGSIHMGKLTVQDVIMMRLFVK